ncbi:hypothetical protein LINPERPRIM_LOCUS8573 [Linum perenne]
MSPYWHHYQLDLRCSWFIWLQSRSPAPVLTQPGVSELLSSSARTSHGMTCNFD